MLSEEQKFSLVEILDRAYLLLLVFVEQEARLLSKYVEQQPRARG